MVALLDHLGVECAILGGAGLGTTITLRAAVAYPERVQAAILISVEDIEDDEKKKVEIAERARRHHAGRNAAAVVVGHALVRVVADPLGHVEQGLEIGIHEMPI